MKKQFRLRWFIGPLTRKVTALLLTVIMIPSVIISVYVFYSINRNYQERILADRHIILGQTVTQIDTHLLAIQNRCQYIADNNLTINLLRKGNLVEYPVYTKHYVEDIVSIMRHTFEYQILTYRDICIYSDVVGLPENSVFHSLSALYEKDFWKEISIETDRCNLILLDQEDTASYYDSKNGSNPKLNHVALMVYDIFDHYHGNSLGLLVLEFVPNNLFSRAFDSSSMCLLFPRSLYSYGNLPKGVAPDSLSEISTDCIESEGKIYGIARSERFGYTLIDSNGISSDIYMPSGISMALLPILVASVIVFGFLLLIRYFMNRINESITVMDSIIENRFDGRIGDVRDDELGQIDQRFNRMLDEISAQAGALVAESEARKSAQYDALRQQLNPHFIYNTLNLFSGAAQQANQPALGDAIAFFGHLLHYNLKDTGSYALLGQEIDNVRALVEVHSLDSSKMITLCVDVPENLLNLKVMRYLLQPLIENSISHGLLPGRPLNITISAGLVGDHLRIRIYDNGAGISKERMDHIDALLSSKLDSASFVCPGHLFIGLRNTLDRLKLFYGEDAALSVTSEEGLFTSVLISIPYMNII